MPGPFWPEVSRIQQEGRPSERTSSTEGPYSFAEKTAVVPLYQDRNGYGSVIRPLIETALYTSFMATRAPITREGRTIHASYITPHQTYYLRTYIVLARCSPTPLHVSLHSSPMYVIGPLFVVGLLRPPYQCLNRIEVSLFRKGYAILEKVRGDSHLDGAVNDENNLNFDQVAQIFHDWRSKMSRMLPFLLVLQESLQTTIIWITKLYILNCMGLLVHLNSKIDVYFRHDMMSVNFV